MLEEECDYPENNALYLMLLSGDLVTYGDERRTKQRHIATHQIYKGVLDHSGDNEEEWYVYDISGLLREYAKEYATDRPNNLLCTTTVLRDCHYRKQENNAYYHIQAINLPFQNIEFYYLTLDQKMTRRLPMNFEPQTYEELIRMKRCVELTKYYEVTEEELWEIYHFLEQEPEAFIKGGRQNLSLIIGQNTAKPRR